MRITSFLDGFEDARKTARERRFEKEANVFQGEGEKARSLLETYKEEQKQFEQNQQRKRNLIKILNRLTMIFLLTKQNVFVCLMMKGTSCKKL